MASDDVPARDLAYVALGSNLDDPLGHLRGAAHALGELTAGLRLSSIYRTVAVGGPPEQPDYLNAVAAFAPLTPWSTPAALLEALLAIERAHGRIRRERWGPRSLDLDLLALGEARLATPDLTLPHPRLMERAFVLAPLCELAPAWRHPVSGDGACEALARLGREGVQRTRLHWRPR